MQLGGPIWSDSIHDAAGLLEEVNVSANKYGTIDRIKGLLPVIAEVGIICTGIVWGPDHIREYGSHIWSGPQTSTGIHVHIHLQIILSIETHEIYIHVLL